MTQSFHNFLRQGAPSQHAVVCLVSATYPLLCIAQLRAVLAHSVSTPIQTVHAKEGGLQTVKRLLQTSFLGMRKIYFLHEVDDLTANEKKELFNYLAQYTGPNTVYFVTQAVESAQTEHTWQVVELPATVDRALWDELIAWHGVVVTERMKKSATYLFKKHTAVPLQTACLLIRYMQVLGGSTQEFFDQWLDVLLPPDQSLFELSQHFFKKNAHDFFVQWHAVKDLYPAQFWVSFWSEQVWRAALFVMLSRKKQHAQARAIAFRLPFSFINHDWKNYTVDTLIATHSQIYQIDYDLKNGGSDYVFDLLYSQFFTDALKK